MRPLPRRVETATGDVLDITFPLHADTASAMRVDQLLGAVLDAIDRDIKICGETANGDVLQAVAMALAVRARMINAPAGVTAGLSEQLLKSANAAASDAERRLPESGNA
ncbi:MAG: hypothetical protein WD075_00420 [Rhodospirillales bacterium]